MKLQTKLLLVLNSKGNNLDFDGIDIAIMLNGKLTDMTLQDLFANLELDEGEIYGNSLFSYYNVEDGKLVVPGSEVQLVVKDTNEPIIIRGIKRPSVNDDMVVSFDQVREFAERFEITKPDEVFTNLNDEEKQFFIDERNKKQQDQETGKQKAAREKQEEQENQEKEAANETARKKAEQELKASIDPKYVQEKKDYISTQRFYAGIDFKEYIIDQYHLFYGNTKEQDPTLLIKRGETWFEEIIDFDITDETDKTVVIEFTNGDKEKQLTLLLETGEITVTDI